MVSPADHSPRITLLLHRWKTGDAQALHELIPLVYRGLYDRAKGCLRHERKHHSLSSTALVNEVYLRLVGEQDRTWENRNHFFAVATTIMRHLLVHYAEARNTQKRGGQAKIFTPEDLDELPDLPAAFLLDLEAGLQRLRENDPRKARVFELRYLVGFSIEEVAEHTRLSTATVKRDIAFTKVWLRKYIKEA